MPINVNVTKKIKEKKKCELPLLKKILGLEKPVTLFIIIVQELSSVSENQCGHFYPLFCFACLRQPQSFWLRISQPRRRRMLRLSSRRRSSQCAGSTKIMPASCSSCIHWASTVGTLRPT